MWTRRHDEDEDEDDDGPVCHRVIDHDDGDEADDDGTGTGVGFPIAQGEARQRHPERSERYPLEAHPSPFSLCLPLSLHAIEIVGALVVCVVFFPA